MTTKLVVRVLNEAEQLLAWAEVLAEVRGDGCLWVTGQHPALVEVDGVPAFLSTHWADVNVETRVPYVFAPVKAGGTITLSWPGPALVVGPAAGGLPPVTVRAPVGIAVPVGVLGVRVP